MHVAHHPCADAGWPRGSRQYGASACSATPAPAPGAGLTVRSPLLDAGDCTHRKSARLLAGASSRMLVPA